MPEIAKVYWKMGPVRPSIPTPAKIAFHAATLSMLPCCRHCPNFFSPHLALLPPTWVCKPFSKGRCEGIGRDLS